MLAQQQPQSRWRALIERWRGRLERFQQVVDPFSDGPERRLKSWAVAPLSLGLIMLAALIGFGVWWMIDHHKWHLIVTLLKATKLFGAGLLIIAAFLFGSKATKSPLPEGSQSGDGDGAKE